MYRSLSLGLAFLSIYFLSACAAPTAIRKPEPVPAGMVYYGDVLNITTPNSEGWYLLESSPNGMAFARNGSEPGESFAAQVLIFDPPQTDSQEKFEALIVQGARSDAETKRISTKTFTHEYSDARGYPCVRMYNVSEDRQAQTGKGVIKTLILQNEHLYCRHPIRRDIGFAITYSHRGNSLYPEIKKEAQSFIEGVKVPSNGTTQ
ncbi:MAG: hypothetical protein ABW161_13410 [Candidatus Thiodiazotropha sp.]